MDPVAVSVVARQGAAAGAGATATFAASRGGEPVAVVWSVAGTVLAGAGGTIDLPTGARLGYTVHGRDLTLIAQAGAACSATVTARAADGGEATAAFTAGGTVAGA
ncbi:hypothetical protein P0W64_12080 [Tsukamurella sp. 8F]|uniref:hypothetical protein n=1 Tax=unclassified Tsukamurella TaxID=2633480 RepID=UPI0023B96989|nr:MULTISPECIES: hypothetical protein [unclassified Tsukamurella]MDF0532057.1 hypothetical protein [Tsukamurella sp. 8J]MDF0587512.1 hypothetical protein [Tsukamurella sp. 8F]